jgi:DNA-binding transcriptional LysR family regulator
LTRAALDHAALAWSALRAPEPTRLNEIAATHSPELRFLAEAFERLSREYPSTRDGLSLTERRILSAIAEGRPTAGGVFARVGARETRPFLGDTWLFDRITRLSAGAAPLLDVESAAVVAHTPVRLTGAGRRVLDGQDDNVALNGVERWIGGVHLTGRDVRWRWDEGAESIIGYAE